MIEKIKGQPKVREDGAPSISWFYNAVNLAAHEAICEQDGLQTFGILGHSHKLQLLHIPKLKSVKAEDFNAELQSAFEQKEELAKAAIQNRMSVREFKQYIELQYPSDKSDTIDLTTIKSIEDLRKHESKELVHAYNTVQRKIENNQNLIRTNAQTLNRLGEVIAEKGKKLIPGKGRFKDWTEPKNGVNICTGCENDCIYCYAKIYAVQRKQVQQGQWPQMTIRKDDVDKTRSLQDGLVMFPTSHDITPTNINAYLTVLGKLLRAGNEVLIVTKPRLECIEKICSACYFFKDKILFRFTIGAMDDGILKFWEPNAPCYQERKECLEYAKNQGFRTSVSMEPMLDTPNIEALVNSVLPFVTEDIWLGTMNHPNALKENADLSLKRKIIKIEQNQLPSVLNRIKDKFKSEPRIKWMTSALRNMNKDRGKVEIPWEKTVITDAAGVQKEVDAPYIISATRRSDIPNHFSDDFMNALRQGHISIARDDNESTISFEKTRFIVFWTKNPEPMLKYLDEIDRMGIGYYFSYTLNNYDDIGLEPHLPFLQQRIATFRSLSSKVGKEKVVWRFDPLILTDKINRENLIDRVDAIMRDVAGYTEKLVISFLDPSKHGAERRLKKAGIDIQKFSDEDKLFVSNAIVQMANQHGIQVSACAEACTGLQNIGILPNKCIDDDLIRSVTTDAQLHNFLDKIKGLKDPTQRDLCCCIPSYDIGREGTCNNGCLYCYARKNWKSGYLYVSVLQKAIRRHEINLARYYAKQVLELGKPGWIWNRLFVISAEDIGLADPTMVGYVKERYDAYENLRIQKNIKKSDVINDSDLCEIIDQVVVAAAVSYKSRLLPMLSFITLFDIYKNETFTKDVPEYLNCFVDALDKKDERAAVYYATIIDTFLGNRNQVLSLIKKRSKNRNTTLISDWEKEYVRSGERLMLVGSIVMLCREIHPTHGEYKNAFQEYLSDPITEESIPDYAYDMHTKNGEKLGRSYEHFFKEAAQVVNEKFANTYQAEGEKAYLKAEEEKVKGSKKVIEAVKKRLSEF